MKKKLFPITLSAVLLLFFLCGCVSGPPATAQAPLPPGDSVLAELEAPLPGGKNLTLSLVGKIMEYISCQGGPGDPGL